MSHYTDEVVSKMHYRQAEILMQVPVEDRDALMHYGHFRMNVIGGNLSGNLWDGLQRIKVIGAEALNQEVKDDNARLMGWK